MTTNIVSTTKNMTLTSTNIGLGFVVTYLDF